MSVLRRIESERGSALPAVVGIMLVIGILAAVIQQTSTQVSNRTTAERAEKRAFQAAEAGLHVAKYRLSKSTPAPSPAQCFTTAPVTTAGDCPQTPAESVGGGASFRYTVTKVLTSTSTECDAAGLNFAAYNYRCITSVGRAKGATRRVQVVVRIPIGGGKFPVNGILVLGDMKYSGSIAISGAVASNGKVDLTYMEGATFQLGPTATLTPGTLPFTRVSQDFTAPVDASVFAASQATNDNAQWPTAGGNLSLNAFRELRSTGDAGSLASPLIVPGGTYNFCNVDFGNKVRLRPAPGALVRIYIDSPARAGSGCRAGTGDFIATGEFDFTTADGNASSLQIEMYGGSGSEFKLSNKAKFNGTLYAPATTFTTTNQTVWKGGIAAASITTSNSFVFDAAVPSSLTSGSTTYTSQAWNECVRTGSSSTAAGAGC